MTASSAPTRSTSIDSLCAIDREGTPEQQRHLDEQGYVIVPDIFGADGVEEMRSEVDRLQRIEGEYGDHEVHIEPGAMRLSSLFNKSPVEGRMIQFRSSKRSTEARLRDGWPSYGGYSPCTHFGS